jgi:hypothetical protein
MPLNVDAVSEVLVATIRAALADTRVELERMRARVDLLEQDIRRVQTRVDRVESSPSVGDDDQPVRRMPS